MIKSIAPFLVISLLAAPAFAQEAETPSDPADELDLGSPTEPLTADELVPGQPYVRGASGDWEFRCLKAEEGAVDPCQIYQLLKDDQGTDVAEISIFPLPGSQRAAAGATIVVPLETQLTEQLTISVDGRSPRVYAFTFCNTAGCVARVGFTRDEINAFKNGRAATLRMVPAAAPDQEVLLEVSLIGFTAGYDELEAELQ